MILDWIVAVVCNKIKVKTVGLSAAMRVNVRIDFFRETAESSVFLHKFFLLLYVLFENVSQGERRLTELFNALALPPLFIVASHAEEDCPDLKSTDNASTHDVIYAHHEPGSSSSSVALMAKERKTSLPLHRCLTENLWLSSRDPSQASVFLSPRCQKKSFGCRSVEGKKSSKTILPWQTKGISGLRENRSQMFLPKPEEEMFTTWCVHLVYQIGASSTTSFLSAFYIEGENQHEARSVAKRWTYSCKNTTCR